MVVIAFALAVSLGFVVVVCAVLALGGGALGVALLSALATFVFLVLLAPPLALQAFLTSLIASICSVAGLKLRFVALGAAAAMIVSVGLVVTRGVHRLIELDAMRATYPVESLAPRLSYERGAARDRAAETSTERLALSPVVESHLSSRDAIVEQMPASMRTRMLEALHLRKEDEFILAAGFGSVRMVRVTPERLELPARSPILLPPASHEYSPDQSLPLAHAPAESLPQPSSQVLYEMHAAGLSDLLDHRRMGYVRDREHVAGFVSHQFSVMPQLASYSQPTTPWQTVRLDLVSLLRHEEPVAYVSEHLPRMDELVDAPTRPLDSFESQALPRLRADDDIVIHEGASRIQMIGALRASNDCLKCHEVRRGELLGALSYELVPVADPAPPKEPELNNKQADHSADTARFSMSR